MRRARIVVIAVAAAALGIVGGGAAVAASGAFSPEERSQAVIDDAAEQLGIEPGELSAALQQALKNQLDEDVDAGRLTEEQADALKKRIDSADVPLVLGGLRSFPPDFGFGFGHFAGIAGLDAAASYLGLSESDLRSRLTDGKSLAEIAKAEGKSVDGLVNALTKAAGERIDQAVEDGKLSKDRAAELKEDLNDLITELVNREPGSAPFLRKHGPGFGFDRGFHRFGGARPDFFFGPRA
jgi:polyhydroxyalkanoate synthesis regulator phasin